MVPVFNSLFWHQLVRPQRINGSWARHQTILMMGGAYESLQSFIEENCVEKNIGPPKGGENSHHLKTTFHLFVSLKQVCHGMPSHIYPV